MRKLNRENSRKFPNHIVQSPTRILQRHDAGQKTVVKHPNSQTSKLSSTQVSKTTTTMANTNTMADTTTATHTNITLWKQHLPCRVRFATKPQHAEAPGPKQHTGILFDVKLKTVKGNKNKSTYEFYVLYNDPLDTTNALKVFTGFQFIMTCYYNWDVEGRLAPTTRYLRDFRSQYTEVETQPNKWTTMRDILRTPDPDVPLNTSLLPQRNDTLVAMTQGFDTTMCIERPHLYGRGGRSGGGVSGGISGRTKPTKVKAVKTTKEKKKTTTKKRGRKPKKQNKYEDEDEEDDIDNSDDDSDDEDYEEKSPKRSNKHDGDEEWLPRGVGQGTGGQDIRLIQSTQPLIQSTQPTLIPTGIPLKAQGGITLLLDSLDTCGNKEAMDASLETSANDWGISLDLPSMDLFSPDELTLPLFETPSTPTPTSLVSSQFDDKVDMTALDDKVNMPALDKVDMFDEFFSQPMPALEFDTNLWGGEEMMPSESVF